MSTIPQTILNKALQDKFALYLELPKILKGSESRSLREKNLVNLDKLQFSLMNAKVPNVSIPAEDVRIMGQSYNVSSHSRPNYPPIRINFLVDNNYDNYWVLWKWLSLLNTPLESGIPEKQAQMTANIQTLDNLNHKTNYKEIERKSSAVDYQTTITLQGLREYNEPVIKFDFYNAFITNLGEIDYDYKNTGEIVCSFEYQFNQLNITLIDPK